ncbi:universal stress protein [Oleiagrimonas citrea]
MIGVKAQDGFESNNGLAPTVEEAVMYKRILISTDGSEHSKRAIAQGVTLARSLGASVVGLNAAPSLSIDANKMDDISHSMEVEYRRAVEEQSRAMLSEIEKAAGEAGVSCQTHFLYGDPVHRSIIKAADDNHCDLVVMGSHGRGSVGTLLLGSVTQKVLAHDERPVLVVR